VLNGLYSWEQEKDHVVKWIRFSLARILLESLKTIDGESCYAWRWFYAGTKVTTPHLARYPRSQQWPQYA
jgi:hypothetical protein